MTIWLNDGRPFAVQMASDLGLRRKDLYELAAEGRLRKVFKGVFVDSLTPDTRQQRLEAIRLITPADAVVSNESASWLMGVDAFKPSEQFLLKPSFVVPHGTTRLTVPGVKCRQARMQAKDIVEIEGVLVTTPLRTTSDLLRRLYRPYALAAADGMAHAGLVHTEEVWEFVAKLKGYPGIVQARSLALLIDPLAASAGESWHRLRICDAGFPLPTAQFKVTDAYGRERFLDLAYPHLKIATEYDGREFHTAEYDVTHDASRRSYLSQVLGWRFVIARKESIFGTDASFEFELGKLLGMEPLARFWGTKSLAIRTNSLAA